MINRFTKIVVLVLLIVAMLCTVVQAQRVTVSNTKLVVNGAQIFLAGGNTPWNAWNDFGGNYTSSWWDAEFARIKAAGGNTTRIWITCDGEVGFNVTDAGLVSGMTAKFWTDLDDLFALATKNKIYIYATMMSFDHAQNTHTNYQRWRNMLLSAANVDAFVANYITPFAVRYKDNPYLVAMEPCNEIEWINQNAICGNIAWNYLQYYAAKFASAVHKNSSILVTIGLSMKWQTDAYAEGNLFSDTRLKAQYNDASVYLDFYSPHFYDWVIQYFGNPFDTSTVASYALSDKPCIIGECPANGIGGKTITEAFENCYKNGFQGLLPWTTNGVDSNGSLSTGLAAALTTFKNNHPALIDPSGGTTPPTATTVTRTATATTVTRTATATTVTRTATATTVTRTSTTLTRTPTATRGTATSVSRTATRTSTTLTRTATVTATTITRTATATAASTGSVSCPVALIAITPNFTKEGAGQFCYEATSLGNYINSWNLTTLTVNGVDFTNKWVPKASLPALIGGKYIVYFYSTVSYGHFEAMN